VQQSLFVNEDPNHTKSKPAADARISHATRFAIACVVLGFSYLSIRSSLSISNFERIFEDMLGRNERLPWLTLFVLRARPAFIVLSCCIPIACIALLFARDIARSIYGLGILILVAMAEGLVLFHALFSPLVEIINRMSSSGPP